MSDDSLVPYAGKDPSESDLEIHVRPRWSLYCPAGHPLFGKNLRIYKRKDGYLRRRCRTCDAEANVAYRARKRR
jgi:hypothetical protein